MGNLKEIEREAAANRQNLASSLDALAASVNPSNLRDQASALVQEYGGDIGQQAWGAARQNPAAFALVGAGLGLLLLGTGTRPDARAPKAVAVPPQQAFDGFEDRVAQADAEMKQQMTGLAEPEESAPRAAWLRAKLEDGLDALPPKARTNVRKARQAALDAQEKIEAQAQAVAAKSRGFMHDQPLAVGAVALGLGALIGALLPSTRREDALLGEKRDALMAAANSTLRDEMDKVQIEAQARISGKR